MGKPITDPLDRIMSRITVTGDGCWEYPCRNESGYGVVGEGPRGGKTIRTHRLVYERLVGPIPEGLDIDHLCRNRACCNPAHLEPVTRLENYLRGARKTRQTHCKRGHQFSPANTVIRRGARICMQCQREATRNSQRSAYAAIKQAVELLGITHREYRAQFGRSRQAAMKIINEMENAS